MNCSVHHEREASSRCFECGRFICETCAVEKDGKVVCKECSQKQAAKIGKTEINIHKEKIQNKYSRTYNPFWALIFSLIPGAGQMYLGLMKRGLQLMLLFIAPIVLASIFYTEGWISVFNVIIWFYSFFDCLHIRRVINGGEEVEDKLIYDINMIDIKGLNYKHVGIGLIGIGGLVILNNGFAELARYIDNHFSYTHDVYRLFRFIRQSSFPVFLIIIGVFLLKKSRVQKKD